MTQDQDERFEARLKEWASGYNQPPADVPREAMWDAIARRRAARKPTRRVLWVRWGVGLAAAMALGVGLGRFTASESGPDTSRPVPSGAEAVEAPSLAAYDVSAREHLDRVESFLTVFRAQAREGSDVDLGTTARALLRRTRLLRSSPAAGDPAVRQLLDDIEFLLVLIAQYDAAANGGDDLDIIDYGIERRGVLLKLRTVASQGA